jgi:hypothetical protein
MELEILVLPNKEAYDAAMVLSPDFVRNRTFRVRFLRSVQYNIRAAAQRFVTFFDAKLELFGVDQLARTIVQDDLDFDDRACLNSGYCSVLPMKDAQGRLVFVGIPWCAGNFRVRENKVRGMETSVFKTKRCSRILCDV